jgi:hypothetical protein
MNIFFVVHVWNAPISPAAIHSALIHLMKHKAHATRYLAMSPQRRMTWLTALLRKYYLWGAHEVFVVVLVLLLLMMMMMMYILKVAGFNENWCQVRTFCEVIYTRRLMNLCCITSSCSCTSGAMLWSTVVTMLVLLIIWYILVIAWIAISSNTL